MMMLANRFNGDNDDVDGDDDFKHLEQETCSHSATLPLTHCFEKHSTFTLQCNHMVPEGRLYSSKSTNGGKGLQNSKINSYFTP